MLFGLPVSPQVLTGLDQLSRKVKLQILVDHIDHINMLAEYSKNQGTVWSVFVKLDLGSNRAGIPLASPCLPEIIQQIARSPVVDLYGFYSYAPRSASATSIEHAQATLIHHLDRLLQAAKLCEPVGAPLTLAIGSSGVTRVVASTPYSLPPNVKLEVVAGTIAMDPIKIRLLI